MNKTNSEISGTPPYRVDAVEQIAAHCEDGYTVFGHYDTLNEALTVAREITEEGINAYDSIEQWRGCGVAGLVYDSKGSLIWSGVEEYKNKKHLSMKHKKKRDKYQFPEPAILYQYLRLMYEVVVYLRYITRGTNKEVSDLLNAVHNVPKLLVDWPDFREDWVIENLESYEKNT